ncbi:MAG: S9 family peptidase, partial [Sphingopyxis sp.]|nr:S9 family peptidase [Sphingopyxis sp.]
MIKLDRRRFLGTLAATATLAAIPSRIAAQGTVPTARTVSAIDDYYGTRLTDPYRWMESGTDPEWMPWMRGQDAATRTRLAELPGRSDIGARVASLSGETVSTGGLTPLGDGALVYEQRPAGSQFFALYRRNADGSVTTLLDPATMRDGD